ncbi:UbiA family prenyltransferase [Stigmatella sp. ncwal1]|uniref:UbiA family prenyltransferase n=1 Tax=Stigmatella ashevillensis TaxID=2995309 RepID=A0ABT5D5G8_9BACT|nr:UbiA family prenyltransferase [Stigmatella ashevillena]MDC0707491.1 UbiA family prenyltransferase [Stigmatella ashevillena]
MTGRGYKELVAEGRQWLLGIRQGGPWLPGIPWPRFVGLIIEAMRPHYFAFGVGAALAGAAAVREPSGSARVALAAFVAGTGWGVGQLINDLLDRDTDAVNAPGRPLADGRLPAGPAIGTALVLGLVLLVALLAIHPVAWMLGPAAVVLLVGYNKAKGIPLVGNLIFGAINTVAAALGVLARLPSSEEALSSALTALAGALPLLGLILGINAWFVLANYEKDRLGDRAAGYKTLPLLMGVRASAFVRAVSLPALACGILRLEASPEMPGAVALTGAAVLGGLSVLPSLLKGTDEAALRGYRLAVPASLLAMLGLAAPLLGGLGLAIAALASVALMEATFLRTHNP